MTGQEPPKEKEEEKSLVEKEDDFQPPAVVDDTKKEAPEIEEDENSQPRENSESGSESGPNKEKKAKPRSESIGKTFGLVALVTFMSKFVGLARDISILTVFGTSSLTDAYYFAYLLTGNILVLFGGLGGPFHSAAVSIITPKKDDSSTRELVTQILLVTAAILTVIASLVWLLAPYIIPIVTPGADSTSVLAALNIMIPLIVIAGLVGAGAGISNVYRVYFWPSIAPAIASIAIIAGVFLYPDKNTAVICLATATLAGAIGQFLVQMPGIVKSKPKLPSFTKLAPGLKAYLLMLGPAAIATTIGQLNIYIDAYFVSQLEHGSYTALLNANRLIQLPLGVLLTAMIVPILPRFSEQVASDDIDELKGEFRRALRFLWFLVLPLVTILFALSGPVVELLFQRGSFDERSKEMVVLALTFLIPMVFFYVARDLLTRVFYAHQDSTTPFRIGLAAICVKAISDYLLVGPLGLGGITLSTTITTIFNMTLLLIYCSKKIGSLGLRSLIKPALIMVSASLACGFSAYYCHDLLITQINIAGSLGRFISLVLSIGFSALSALAVYASICLLVKLEEPQMAYKKISQIIKNRIK